MRSLLRMFVVGGLLIGVCGCGKGGNSGGQDELPPRPAAVGNGLRVVNARTQFKLNFAIKGEGVHRPYSLFLTENGKRLVVTTTLKHWQTQVWSVEGEPRKTAEFDGEVTLLLPDGKKALGRREDSTISEPTTIFDLETGQHIPTTGYGLYLRTPDVVISPNISHVWDQPEPFELAVFDLKAGKILPTLTIGKDNRVRAAPPIKQGRELIYALPREDLIKVRDFDAGRVTREFKLKGGKRDTGMLDHTCWDIFRVSQPDGRWIAVRRLLGLPVEIFDGATGDLVATLPESMHIVGGEFVPGHDIYLTNSLGKGEKGIASITAFAFKKNLYTSVYRGNTLDNIWLAVSGNGTVMATAQRDGSVTVWDLGQLD